MCACLCERVFVCLCECVCVFVWACVCACVFTVLQSDLSAQLLQLPARLQSGSLHLTQTAAQI